MRKCAKTVILALLATCAVAIVPSSAMAVSSTYPFPSSSSTVVGSVGFIDDDEIGFFWSAARGDRVSETFIAPFALPVNRAILQVEVVQNVLNSGAQVNWNIEINGTVVGSFVVPQGFIGPIVQDVSFLPIMGPAFTVTLRVTNEVPSGQGSHTFAYAGPFAHSIQLFQFALCEPQTRPPSGMPCKTGRP
jgi:hypothetical protein